MSMYGKIKITSIRKSNITSMRIPLYKYCWQNEYDKESPGKASDSHDTTHNNRFTDT